MGRAGSNITVLDIEELARNKPLLYATSGNTGGEALIDLVAEAFRDDPTYEVLLTTGVYIDPDRVSYSDNIHVERFIPGSAVMRLSQAVIHCGSQATAYQALAQGKPALAIPFNNDQRNMAWLIKKNKVGIPLSAAWFDGRARSEGFDRAPRQQGNSVECSAVPGSAGQGEWSPVSRKCDRFVPRELST